MSYENGTKGGVEREDMGVKGISHAHIHSLLKALSSAVLHHSCFLGTVSGCQVHHQQSTDFKFRLVIIDVKSCIWLSVSWPSVDGFGIFGWNLIQGSSKSIQNVFKIGKQIAEKRCV